MKILRTDAELSLPGLDDRLRAEGHQLTLLPDGVNVDRLIDEIADADLLLMCYTPIPRPVIEAAPRLRGIVKYGVGIDAIDIGAARERGITVVNIPEYAESTVAEGAFLLLLALLRKLPSLSAKMQSDGWVWPETKWLGRDMKNLTLGIVGLGRIGSALARMAGAGFGAKVLAYDPRKPDDAFAEVGAVRCNSLEELLAHADAVSLHATLNVTSRYMIGAHEISLMNPGTYLINVSRGSLVDETALIEALDRGHLAGAGLDVYEREPLIPDHPLLGRSNVVLLPHLTFWTREALLRLEADTYARIQEFAAGAPITIRSRDPRLAGQENAIYPD